jgi:hypothetical protein
MKKGNAKTKKGREAFDEGVMSFVFEIQNEEHLGIMYLRSDAKAGTIINITHGRFGNLKAMLYAFGMESDAQGNLLIEAAKMVINQREKETKDSILN